MRLLHRLAPCLAAVAIGLLVGGCGETGSGSSSSGGSGGSKTSEANTDHSEGLKQSIESDGPHQLTHNLSEATSQPESSISVSLSEVSCTRSGSTQNYECIATENVSDSAEPSLDQTGNHLSITGTCNNEGQCSWHST